MSLNRPLVLIYVIAVFFKKKNLEKDINNSIMVMDVLEHTRVVFHYPNNYYAYYMILNDEYFREHFMFGKEL